MVHSKKEKMEAFGRFLDILDELREKCPWDRKQTNESLRTNTIEETFELCDAIIRNNDNDIKKELMYAILFVKNLFSDTRMYSETTRFRSRNR